MSRLVATRCLGAAILAATLASAGPVGAVPLLGPRLDPLPPGAPPPGRTGHVYTRGQAVALALASASFATATLLVDLGRWPAIDGVDNYGHDLMAVAAIAPLAFVAPRDGLELGGVTLATIGGETGLRHGARLDPTVWHPFRHFASDVVSHEAQYAPFAVYREARRRGAAPDWGPGWVPTSGAEMFVSPFHLAYYKRPVVLVATAAEALLAGALLIHRARSAAPLAPPTTALNLGLAVPTSMNAAIGEEALFRGFYYEELARSVGRWPARIVDAGLFAAYHIPGEYQDQTPGQLGVAFAVRSTIGVAACIAYDEGGLGEAVAMHTAIDVIVFAFDAFAPTTAPSTPARVAAPRRPIEVVVPVWSGRF